MEAKIKRGTVLLADYADWNMPHKKFAAVVGETQDFFVCFIINSKPSGIPPKKDFQVKLPAGSYKFFSHDSFADCAEIKRIDKSKLKTGGGIAVKGSLCQDDLCRILSAGKNEKNILVSPKNKSLLS